MTGNQDEFALLYEQNPEADAAVERYLTETGFRDWQLARKRLLDICGSGETRQAIQPCFPTLMLALSDAAVPDGSLINFERFVQSVPDRIELFRYLAAQPRAVEILIRLFVGSQFLTEILLRNPNYLERLSAHKRLAELKSRENFIAEAREQMRQAGELAAQLDALRKCQRWELLRIGACDTFHLMDLKSITTQLSLLTDSVVQCCLDAIAANLDVDPQGFVVLGFGKLGGEELNYSSDIDLVFLSDTDSTRFWQLGQRLIKALMEATAEGFLYRVDMRLRPWGSSGALVNTVDSHLSYLRKHGRQWERQALLKARPIAGDLMVGRRFLENVEPLIYDATASAVRANVSDMKQRIEAELHRQGRTWGEVKAGPGSIRDIEFVTQYLQLIHGQDHPQVRSFNTLDGLVRLADFGFVQADEYRILSSGYVFLRTVEHALQLMHNKQTHSLPSDRRELAYLARRLDYPSADEFLSYFDQHVTRVRAIFEKYLSDRAEEDSRQATEEFDPIAEHVRRLEASYAQTFDDSVIDQHLRLLNQLSQQNPAELAAVELDNQLWELTVVGFDVSGDLSVICGLLFVYGFDIVSGQVFTDEQVVDRVSELMSRPGALRDSAEVRRFVNVFIIDPPSGPVTPQTWQSYKRELIELLELLYAGKRREAQGRLAKRVAKAVRRSPESDSLLHPVVIGIDNSKSDSSTVLDIRGSDTIGFLYELSNALTMTGIDIVRVIVSTQGDLVLDTLYVTDAEGAKITDDQRQRALRAAVVLIKHFTHLLPRSPNPESALLHFREFLEGLFEQDNWVEELSSLQNTEVLSALAKLLGVSDFLWQDFLRLQHQNLFPVVRDIDSLKNRTDRQQLDQDLARRLSEAGSFTDQCAVLNGFKDREMFRTDMRHILGFVEEFGQFSRELTDVAEVTVEHATRICLARLNERYGQPRLADGRPCPLAVAALGKCGGRELGFASDIELMFVYEGSGQTDGPESIGTTEFYLKLVELFMQTIEARREGIFQLDLRLRPYGRAGALAVSLEAFQTYFALSGPAWPYERQALVKLRAIAGDRRFGRQLEAIRDELVFTPDGFDVAAMRGMRERQVSQLVSSGSINAKLSPGGLVDSEYLVQGLQMTYGNRFPELRTTNTLSAIRALQRCGILDDAAFERLSQAYIFQRRLIDALRMVRGHAKDLTVPPEDSEEFEFLARRLGDGADTERLSSEIESSTRDVLELSRLLDEPGV